MAIRGRSVTLNRWTPAMADDGPIRDGLRHTRAALADLRRDADRAELIVAPVRGTQWDARAERTLLAWAQLVGYRRVWLPAAVITFDDELAAFGLAAIDCPTCGAHWEDDRLEFWESIRRNRWFPASCLACGGSLPEWGLAEAVVEGERTQASRAADPQQ